MSIIRELADRLRSEAALSSQAGQAARLVTIAYRLDTLAEAGDAVAAAADVLTAAAGVVAAYDKAVADGERLPPYLATALEYLRTIGG